METIFRLLDRGLKADQASKPGVTPIHIAVSVPRCDEIVKVLVKHGTLIHSGVRKSVLFIPIILQERL